MHIQVTGRGPALVLLHGWALNAAVFAPLVEQLSDRFQLHLVDLPGHGHSRGDRLPLALEPVVATLAAVLPPALWLGWSLGGLFALHAAATRPQRVRGLAMVASSPRFVRGPDWTDAIAPQQLRRFAVELAADFPATVDRFVALDLMGRHDGPATLHTLRHAIVERGAPTAAALRDGLDLLETCDLRARLPDIAAPALWIAGQRDRLVPAAAMRAAAAAMPDAAETTLAGTGHAPFLARPAQVAALLDALQARAAGHRD